MAEAGRLVVVAAAVAGPPGQWDRWAPVKAAQMPDPATRPRPWTGRRSAWEQQIADLPQVELAEEYLSGVPIAVTAHRHRLAVNTVQAHPRRHGIHLEGHGALPAVLQLRDEELTARRGHATIAELAAERGVSTSLIWRRIHSGSPASHLCQIRTKPHPVHHRL